MALAYLFFMTQGVLLLVQKNSLLELGLGSVTKLDRKTKVGFLIPRVSHTVLTFPDYDPCVCTRICLLPRYHRVTCLGFGRLILILQVCSSISP